MVHEKISIEEARQIVVNQYGLTCSLLPLPGEMDANFKIKTAEASYLLKISSSETSVTFNQFQYLISDHLGQKLPERCVSQTLLNLKGEPMGKWMDAAGNERSVRVLSWKSGRVWSSVNPMLPPLLYELGQAAGQLTAALDDFDHPEAHRKMDWDLAQADWTRKHLDSFPPAQQQILHLFLQRFEQDNTTYQNLRKGVVHNDVNDYNIIVSDDLLHPRIVSIIDYGDALHTQVINDLAITLSYAIMDKPAPLQAAVSVIQGYHGQFPLQEEELTLLYTLVGIRLVISVTKSAINKINDPENEYLLISERPAWELLQKWADISPDFALYTFRSACGYNPHPKHTGFTQWAKKQSIDLHQICPTLSTDSISVLDVSVGSQWLGNEHDFERYDWYSCKLTESWSKFPSQLITGGYGELRPIYTTPSYKFEGNQGPQYRTCHVGIDIWVPAETAVHSPLKGTVFSIHHNDSHKDYGPTIILQHKTHNGLTFYSLYGHLSTDSLSQVTAGQEIKPGEKLGWVGNAKENGHWTPHLHFQLMLDLLGNTVDFPGVCLPEEKDIWMSICPDPNLLFKEPSLASNTRETSDNLIAYRKEHLGKSLSLSYSEPLHIVRGMGPFLLDIHGRKYLDTVNNVAHVGHEHPRVVRAGQEQMAVLNTNTRYLHTKINEFTESLLKTLPPELCVVHFVNSGSEANELALRMAQTYTGQKDMIAMEVGYHGNTGGCVDVSSYKFDGNGGTGAPKHTHIVPLPDSFRGMYTGKDAGEKYAHHVSKSLTHIQNQSRNVAGFICESIISCGGQVELPDQFLSLAFDAVRSAGGICISDEVQTGCGRVGTHFWGFELHGVVPDIVTIGKPIGNGHPLAAVVCTRAVAERFANGMEYFNTFGGNPVSCAIGLEVLRVIQDENLQAHALHTGNALKKGLRSLQKNYPILADVRGQGLFLGFELTDSQRKPLPHHASYLANRMKSLGILMSTDGKDHNVLKIKPPMVFNQHHTDELLTRLETVLQEDFMRL